MLFSGYYYVNLVSLERGYWLELVNHDSADHSYNNTVPYKGSWMNQTQAYSLELRK